MESGSQGALERRSRQARALSSSLRSRVLARVEE